MTMLKKMLWIDFRRAFFNPIFWICSVANAVIYFAVCTAGVGRTINEFIIESNLSGDLVVLCVLGSTLPFAGVFYKDYSSKFIKMLCVRSNSIYYVASKIIIAVLSGGSSMVLSRVIIILFGYIKGYEAFVPDEGLNYIFWSTYFLEDGNVIGYFASMLLGSFLAGAFWCVLGITVSAYIPNSYVAYFIPYIVMLMEKLFNELFEFIPDEIKIGSIWVCERVTDGLIGNLIWCISTTLIYILIFSILFGYKVNRRISE